MHSVELVFDEHKTPTAEVRIPLERRVILTRRLGVLSAMKSRVEALYSQLINERISGKRQISAERMGAVACLVSRANTLYSQTIADLLVNHSELAREGVQPNEYASLFEHPCDPT